MDAGLMLRRGNWHRLAAPVGAGLFLVYIALILLHAPQPSLGDFGDLTYQGIILRDHLLGRPDPFHLVKHYPVPNGAVTVGIALLALVFSPAPSAKLWLCLQLLLSFAVMRHLLRSRARLGLGPGDLFWLIAPTAIFLNLNLWYGFLNFQLGLCWLVLLASCLLRNSSGPWRLGTLLLLGFFSHMVPFALMALLLVLAAYQWRRPRLLWPLAPSLLASLWYLYGRFLVAGNADGQAGMVEAVRQFSSAFWAFKANSVLKSFGWVNLGTRAGSATLRLLGEAPFALLFLLNALLCTLLVWAIARAALVGVRRDQPTRFIWLAVLLAVPVFLLAPAAALGISDPGSRVLEAALALAILLCPPSRAVRAAAFCIAVQAIASLYLFSRAAYTVIPVQASGKHLPHLITQFAHVPNHDKDEYLDALRRGDMHLAVFPTGLLLNTPQAVQPPSREQ